jgi:hypothetical protein
MAFCHAVEKFNTHENYMIADTISRTNGRNAFSFLPKFEFIFTNLLNAASKNILIAYQIDQTIYPESLL